MQADMQLRHTKLGYELRVAFIYRTWHARTKCGLEHLHHARLNVLLSTLPQSMLPSNPQPCHKKSQCRADDHLLCSHIKTLLNWPPTSFSRRLLRDAVRMDMSGPAPTGIPPACSDSRPCPAPSQLRAGVGTETGAPESEAGTSSHPKDFTFILRQDGWLGIVCLITGLIVHHITPSGYHDFALKVYLEVFYMAFELHHGFLEWL